MKYNGMTGTYYNFADGDELTWKGRLLATLKKSGEGDGAWWHLEIKDLGERDMYIGDGAISQKDLDDCVNVFYTGLVIGLVFNEETEAAALSSIPARC